MDIEMLTRQLTYEPKYLNKNSKVQDLLRFKHRKMTSRMRKKFLKHPIKYGAKYIRKEVWEEYQACWRSLGTAIAEEMYSILNRESLVRTILVVEPVNAAG